MLNARGSSCMRIRMMKSQSNDPKAHSVSCSSVIAKNMETYYSNQHILNQQNVVTMYRLIIQSKDGNAALVRSMIS
ncbi:hypothetical protein BMYO_1619 [Bifidobacterium myosotis]|uniref:Uncharacterized protein n=1 Tax=Bifidobacterium myosotis TaxID=1630166 RepID=A0A261FHF2_9BIFI|nr:hypothetical protein BMYO_1619 [Bifidobacterium myosotis]